MSERPVYLKKSLPVALNEKDVENTYRQVFAYLLEKAVVTSPYGCDGFLVDESQGLRVLLEFKYDLNFSDRLAICEVMAQCLYYVKKFEQAGEAPPKVLFVGDKNECFCVSLGAVQKHLAVQDYEWGIAPSSAAIANPRLVKALYDDEEIVPHVWPVQQTDFRVILGKLLDLNAGIANFVPITEANINHIFDEFCDRVVNDVRYKKKDDDAENKSNELVGIFLGILTQPDRFYLHPAKNQKNTLITPTAGNVKVDHKAFLAFFSHFKSDYSPAEREALIAICDRLLEDTKRRWQGAFFTPTQWVNEAHAMLDENLGSNWRDEYVVWDCCCGTLNLTRDYRFKELYCSTLVPDELELGSKYNPEAVKFVYDFLSEPGLDGLPPEAEGLKKALGEGRRVLVLMNPPYGTANNAGREENDHKAGVADSAIADAVRKDCGAAAQQLYAQFMWKLRDLGVDTVAMYTKPLFLTGGSYKKFRTHWVSRYRLARAFMFQASEFADVKGQWGVLFSLWRRGADERCEWSVELLRQREDGSVGNGESKVLYNLDRTVSASEWVREEIKGMKTYDAPQIASGLVVKQAGRGMSLERHDGYLLIKGNTPYENGTGVCLTSSCYVNGCGLSVISQNLRKCCALFTARRTITGKHANWINDKDEYQAPNERHPDYEQWNNDAIVYSLFNTASNQSSLRNVDYKGKTWQIHNEWFWLSRQSMLDLADRHGNDAVWQDAKTDKERHLATLLPTLALSPDAQAVLDKASELVEKTFEYREMAADRHPEWHINTWDAGWYQVKLLLKTFLPAELKEFQALYKALEDRLREGVYEFGFLRR